MSYRSNWLGHSARSLTDAFGPYTDHRISEPVEPMHPTDKVVFVASVIAAVVMFGLIAWGQVQ